MFDFGTQCSIVLKWLPRDFTRCFVAGKFVRLWVKFTVKETTL